MPGCRLGCRSGYGALRSAQVDCWLQQAPGCKGTGTHALLSQLHCNRSACSHLPLTWRMLLALRWLSWRARCWRSPLMQPRPGTCCAGFPTPATLCTQVLCELLQVSRRLNWVANGSLSADCGCRRRPCSPTRRPVASAPLSGEALNFTSFHSKEGGEHCALTETLACAGAPALHLFTESTTVWFTDLTQVSLLLKWPKRPSYRNA